MRNLPTRDFYEGELRALIIKLIEAYNKEKKAESPKFKQLSTKMAIKQVKVLRDETKQHLSEATGEILKLSSGLAFCEFSDPAIALYAVRYLNNLQLSGNRGLIVDFALEDARKMFKRKMKLEKYAKIADEKKKEARTERRKEKRTTLQYQPTVELGAPTA